LRKILFLGGAPHQTNAINIAREQGLYTICCDNNPDNPGHKLAHESKIISTVDTDNILEYASNKELDAIMTYGSDVSLPTLGNVCELLKLRGPSIDQAKILSNKNMFRYLLKSNGLENIKYIKLTSDSNLNQYELGKKINDASLQFPLILKPVDRSGGLGISISNDLKQLHAEINISLKLSLSSEVIVEEYIESKNYQICGDGFMKNGKVVFLGVGNNFFNELSFGPFAEVFPNIIPVDTDKIKKKIEDIFISTNYASGPFNFDIIEKKNGEYVVLELTPRLGGNFLSEAIARAYNINLIHENISFALGDNFLNNLHDIKVSKYFYNLMLHSKNPEAKKIFGKTDFMNAEPLLFNLYDNLKFSFQNNSKISDFVGNCVFKFDNVKEVEEFTLHLKNNDFIM
tara:strand:- start:15903 stop:17105 length:1203 start_codon:yes stop_codon:yes gene_type:complete